MENKLKLVNTCVDSINNPEQLKHFSKGKNVDEQIRKGFYEIMGTDNPTAKDVRRHEVAIFEILEDVLTETYLNGVNEDAFFMRFADVRNIALGDSQEFYIEDDGVVVVSEHAGNHWTINRQKMEGGQSFPVKTKSYAAAIYADFILFVTGRLSFGRMVQKVAEGIQNKIYEEVAASFATATAMLPGAFTATGIYDEEELIEIVSHVEAASGSNPIVLGTRKGLAKVIAGMDKSLFSENMKNELARTGRVADVNGMTLVQLPSTHKVNTFEFAYDDNQLLILPGNDEKFIKIIFEGEDWVKQVTSNTVNNDMSLEYKFLTNFGVATVFNKLFGVYNLQ